MMNILTQPSASCLFLFIYSPPSIHPSPSFFFIIPVLQFLTIPLFEQVSTYFIDDAGQPVEAVLDLSEGIMLKDPTVNALQPNITSATPLTSSLDMSKHNIRASLPLHPSTPNMHRSATDLMTNLEVENAGDHSEANKPDETVINNDGQLQSNKYDAVSDAAEGDENQDHSNDKNILSTSSETGSNADVDKKKIPQGSRVISITSADVTPTVSMSVRSLQATDLVVMIVDSRHTSTYYQQFVNPHNHSELRWHEGNNVSFYRDAWWSDWTTPYGWPVQGTHTHPPTNTHSLMTHCLSSSP